MLNSMIKRRIAKERKRQITKLEYTLEHDMYEVAKEENHLLDEAVNQYEKGRYIEALAMLDADHEILEADRLVVMRQEAFRQAVGLKSLEIQPAIESETSTQEVS